MEEVTQDLPAAALDAHPPQPPRTFTRRIDCAPQPRPVAAPPGDGGGTAANTPEAGA
jgi:hypothetical protein